MNLPRIVGMERIPFKRFLASRWFAWALVFILLTIVGGGGYYGSTIIEERDVYRKQSETFRNNYVQAVKEKVELQETVRQLQDKKTDSRKTIEEVRPDGTRIVIKEETREETATTTDKDRTSETARQSRSTGTTETTKETEEEIKERKVTEGSRFRVGAGVTVRDFDSAPDASVSGTYRIIGPFHGRLTVEVDGATYAFEGASIGIEIEF